MEKFAELMTRCEELASQAASKGNSAVGGLLIINDEVVAEAEETVATKKDVSCHAEMEVIRKAREKVGQDMSGAILITTKEPCVMCSYAIRFHKISTVVYKDKSVQLGGVNSSFNLLISEKVPQTWGPPVQCIQLVKE